MALPKLPALALKGMQPPQDIAVFRETAPTVKELTPFWWCRFAWSIRPETIVNPLATDYPFSIGGASVLSKIRPLMSNCVLTFRAWTMVVYLTEQWHVAAKSRTDKARMTALATVWRVGTILQSMEVSCGPFAAADPHLPNLVLALINAHAITLLSSLDALAEAQVLRRLWAHRRIVELAQPLADHPVFQRCAAALKTQHRRLMAETYVFYAQKYYHWTSPGSTVAAALHEAKACLPFTNLPKGQCDALRDIARIYRPPPFSLGIASDFARGVLPNVPGGYKLYMVLDPVQPDTLFPEMALE